MNILFISVVACQRIIEKKESLKKVMSSFEAQYNFSIAQKVRIHKLLQGVLRNFVSLRYEVIKEIENVHPREKKLYLFICTLYSIRYQSTEIDLDSLKDEFDQVILDNKLNVESAIIFNKLMKMGRKNFVVPEAEKEDPVKYNSLFFSTPEWIIRLWLKQFGPSITAKLLVSNKQPAKIYIKRNELKISSSHFNEKTHFQPVKNFDNAYALNKNQKFDEMNEVKLGNCFKEDLSYQEILNNLPLATGDSALLIDGNRFEMAADLAIRLSGCNGDLTLNIENEIKFRQTKYKFDKLGVRNQKIYLADIDLLRTYIEYNSFDIVVAMPPSSRLGLVKRKAEILASTTKQDYRKLKYQQLSYLEEAKKYVNKDGIFAYVVETINKREGENIVELFLNKYPEYEIVTSRQIMPYEKNNNGVYYALLRRKYE